MTKISDKQQVVGRREFLAASGAALAASTALGAESAPDDMRLTLEGGPKSVTNVPALPIRWGEAERQRLNDMTEQPSLFYWNGPQTTSFVERVRQLTTLKHVMPCSSGTAAVHIAVAAAGIGPGDEVITSPITDVGTVIGVIYQQGVPVFADLGAGTYNLDPQAVERAITPRTKAIIAVHLFGNPCDLDALKEIAARHKLVLIEDCAQAWGAESRGRPIGSVGHIACWSLQDTKHITCGDGGIAASSDERFGPLLQAYGDKGVRRGPGGGFIGFSTNYRMSEPQAAVAAAQIGRIGEIARRRSALGDAFNQQLSSVPAVAPHAVDERDRCVYWFTFFRIIPEALRCDRDQFVKALQAEGVPATPGYIPTPLYQMPMFADHAFFAGRWPVREFGLTDVDYRQIRCPEAEAILQTGVRVPVHEAMTAETMAAFAKAVEKVARHYAAQA